MSAQPISGFQWTVVSGTAAGTTTITAHSAVLYGVFVSGATTGTVTFYDSASGTSAKSFDMVNTTFDQPTTVPFQVQFKKGITYATSGTTSMVAIWDL